MAQKKNTPTGPAVDASGQSVVDPTANVTALVDAAVQRLDDMRALQADRLNDVLMANTKRLDDLLETKIEYIEKMNGMRDLHAIELREAESARIDAIRAVDASAVSQAAHVATAQATTLASQTTTLAEALRTQVAAAVTSATLNLSTALQPVQKDIADLRQAQYQAQGERTNVDDSRARGASTSLWIGLGIAAAGMIMSIVFGVLSIAVTLIIIFTK